MESFHIIILVVASVSLISVLTIAGILLTKDKHNETFPTSHSDKPDGWAKSGGATDADDIILTSDGTNGKSAGTTKTFTPTEWEDICVKKAWADNNGVYWDGITTYNGC
jgi:hypothetical protein